MHKYPYPCELYEAGCIYSACNGLADVPDIAYPTEDDTVVYYPRCYKQQTPQILSAITEIEFARAMRGEFTHQEKVPQSQVSTEKVNEVIGTGTIPESSCKASKKRRHRGHSIFDGQKVHQDIESDSRKQFMKVNNRKFKLTRPMDWQVADQFLRAVQDREDDYVIHISTADHNGLSQAGKDFVKYCLERQRIANPIKGQRYSGKARIIPSLLRANQL